MSDLRCGQPSPKGWLGASRGLSACFLTSVQEAVCPQQEGNKNLPSLPGHVLFLRSCFGTYFIKEVRILREKRRMCQCVCNTVYANEPVKYFVGSCQRSKVTLPGQQLFCLNRQAGLQEMSCSNLNSCVKVSN